MSTFTKEQREQWDKITGPGLYDVIGDGAYDYLCERIRNLLFDGADLHTFLLIGEVDAHERFLKKMQALDVDPEYFYSFFDREQANGDEYYLNLNSLDDTEKFCNLIRQPKATGQHRIGAVVLLNVGEETKHIDKILKVPVLMNGATTFIQLPVFNQCDAEWSEFSKVNNVSPSGVKRTIEVEYGDEMKPEIIPWLMPGFVPLYESTAVSGEMDALKTTTVINIGAAYSVWGDWFNGEKNEHNPHSTLYVSAEDNYARTLLPRWVAAGGAPNCFGSVKLDVTSKQETKDGPVEYNTPLSFDEHLNLLGETILRENARREWPVGLLVCDPIISFFGGKNYNNSQDAREIMRGLKKLCEELKITNINITHFNKTLGLGAKQKTAGSKALIEAHRMAWAFDRMEDDPKITLIAPVKKNLLAEAKSYKITTISKTLLINEEPTSIGVVKFVGYSNMTADDRIEEKELKDRGNRKEIKKAILDALKDGPMPAGRVCNELQDLGSLSSLKRAAASLLEEGKMRRSGTNPKNFVWELATESEQVPIFQGAASNE
jgi:hypothetical protein